MPNYLSLEDFQDLWSDKIKPAMFEYSTAYIGTGESAASVMVSANLKTKLLKGAKTSVTASNTYLWVCVPSVNVAPTVMMSCLAVPMTAQNNVTIEGITYKVLKSNNIYTGTFDIILT